MLYILTHIKTSCQFNFCGITTTNSVPLPTCDFTSIFPFIKLTKLLVIDKPNPNPKVEEFFILSSLTKLSNILSINSSLIPIPVSLIVIVKLHISSLILESTLKHISPLSVYLVAFVNKFTIISFILSLSPYKNYDILGKIVAIMFL